MREPLKQKNGSVFTVPSSHLSRGHVRRGVRLGRYVVDGYPALPVRYRALRQRVVNAHKVSVLELIKRHHRLLELVDRSIDPCKEINAENRASDERGDGDQRQAQPGHQSRRVCVFMGTSLGRRPATTYVCYARAT